MSARPAMTPKVPPVPEHIRMQVRSVEGPIVTLALAATDYRILIGEHCDYVIGHGLAHAFSKDGLFILSGPVPTFLKDVGPPWSADGPPAE